MISPLIYQVLYNKKKNIYIFFSFLILIFCSTKNLYSQNIQPILIINNKLITNIDLQNELLLLKMQLKNKIIDENFLKNLSINNLIDDTIKELESNKQNIKINEIEKINLYESFLKNLKSDQIIVNDFEIIKKNILKKIEINLKWSKLIQKLYISQVQVNLNEINEIVKKNNLNLKQKEKLIINEKKNKLEKFSKSHLIKIKKNYLIKFL